MFQFALLAAALAFGAQRSPSPAAAPTPRVLLERGALAEEHQRDFAGAEKLYEQAEAAAKAAGDAKTASEASAARQRVLARQGKAAPGQVERDAAVSEQLRQRAFGILTEAAAGPSSYDDILRSAQSLADLGPVVIDVLTSSLHGSRSGQSATSPHLPSVAARALERMATEASDQALIKAYESPDPTIRKAVISAARPSRFVELQLRAAEDSVASIREMASASLLNSTDRRAAGYVETLARTGNGTAAEWLAKHAPERCIAIAEDEALDSRARAYSLSPLSASSPPPALLPRLLVLARRLSDQDESLRNVVWSAIHAVKVPEEPERARRLEAIEPLLLAFDSTVDDLSAVSQLTYWGSRRSHDALRAAIDRRSSGASQSEQDALTRYALSLMGKEVGSGDFENWAGLAVAPSSEWESASRNSSQRPFTVYLLSELAISPRKFSLDQWTDFWPRVPAHHQPAYAAEFGRQLRHLTKSKTEFELPADAAPLLRYMLASDSRDAVEAAQNVIQLVKRIDLLEDAIRIPSATSASPGGAVWQLHELDSARAIDAVRRRLSEVVKAQPFDRSGERAIDMLHGLPAAERLRLWKELWALSSTAAREPLLELLVESDDKPETAPLIVEYYSDIERISGNLQRDAVRVFGSALTEAALPILERELRNPDSEVRAAAMEAAEQFRKHREAVAEFDAWRKVVTVEQSTVADLAKLLESDNRDVLLGAVRALGILRARPALPALVKLLERKDPELHTAVKAAIDAIGAN
jgi:HEAT repeat protein